MKQNRIITIGTADFLLNESISDADAIKLVGQLTNLRRCERDYIPNAESRYAETALIASDRSEDVALRITSDTLLSKPLYNEKREAGLKLYEAAHPKEVA